MFKTTLAKVVPEALWMQGHRLLREGECGRQDNGLPKMSLHESLAPGNVLSDMVKSLCRCD